MKNDRQLTTRPIMPWLFSGLLAWAGALGAATLDDIGFTSLPGNEFEITLDFSERPPEPQTYSLDNPARIVLDFPGVQSNLAQRRHELSYENAQNAVVVSDAERTRVVVNLNRMTGYSAAMEGDRVVLRVQGTSRALADREDTGSMFEVSGEDRPPATARSVRNVDFARGERGEGIVTLTLSDPSINVDIQRTGNRIVAEFFQTALPDNLDRRLDVIDFATPVRSIDTRSRANTTTVTLEALGDYDYLAYQTDNRYIISVSPLTPAQVEERKAQFAFVGERLSLNFQDIEVRSVLQLIADFTDLNLVASDTVTGSITLRLQNVPWDQALDIVLKAKGLDKRLEGNVLLVAPAVEIAERERLQVEANKQLQELAPLVTEFIRIRYADAQELFELFDVDEDESRRRERRDDRTATASILSERGTAIVDRRTNTIILTDTADKITEFRRLVEQIDIPIRQVEISARIVIATTDFRRELGFRWGAQGASAVGSNVVGFGGNIENFTAPYNPMNRFPLRGGPYVQAVDEDGEPIPPITPTPSANVPGGESSGLNVDLGVANPAGQLALQLLTNNAYLDLELSALENAGYAEIASQPRVLTGDKQEALILSGKRIPYQEATASGATSTQFEDANLSLRVVPQITPDNRLILNLHITQNNLAAEVFGGVPVIDTTEIQTTALVGDGQTLVLGGIFQYQELDEQTKVPLLGDIPYLGRIFRNDFRTSDKREILIFVTPRIVEDQLLDR